MKLTNKNSFILYADQYASVKKLSVEQRGELLTSLYEYSIFGKILETDDLALDLVFTMFKETLDRDKEKYIAKCEANKRNGSLGGRPPKISVDLKPNGFFENRDKPKKADSDSDNDSDSDSNKKENIKKKKFIKPSFEEIKNYCLERQNNIDVRVFLDYYESNGWKVGKNPMKDWKATIRNWERNDRKKKNNSFF